MQMQTIHLHTRSLINITVYQNNRAGPIRMVHQCGGWERVGGL